MPKPYTLTAVCPCQSGRIFGDCCAPFHQRTIDAPTPEALMRSRYSAFVLGDIVYLQQTSAGSAAKAFDFADCEAFASSVTWLGLTILSTQTLSVVRGLVEFHARFAGADGITQAIHERSVFQKTAGKWYYVDRVKTLKTPPHFN